MGELSHISQINHIHVTTTDSMSRIEDPRAKNHIKPAIWPVNHHHGTSSSLYDSAFCLRNAEASALRRVSELHRHDALSNRLLGHPFSQIYLLSGADDWSRSRASTLVPAPLRSFCRMAL